MDAPVIPLGRVFHVGTMDPSRVGENGRSLEGHSLSVSVCPNDWVAIARLGGRSVHEMTREGGAFLDVLAVMGDPGMRREVEDWAVGEGLLKPAVAWRAWSTDEAGDWRYVTMPTLEDAMDEASFDSDGEYLLPEDVPGPEGTPGVASVEVMAAMPELAARTGMALSPSEDATDAAVVAWAMANCADVDGVWWRESYDPGSLSAPRGAIFPDRVPAWDARPTNARGIDDADEVAAFPCWLPASAVAPAPVPAF